jgi:hypothetical protein
MEKKEVNIISFDVPYPADYGGVIDVFHKVRLLHASGIDVHLHCFDYGRGIQPALQDYCKTVHYYPRRVGWKSFISLKPYIVHSRKSEELIINLLKNNYPIICEGIHTTAILLDRRLAQRIIAIRPTNIEHDYYRLLASREMNFFKKIFFLVEAFRLKKFDAIHQKANVIFPVSDADYQYFISKFPMVKSVRVYPFNAMDRISVLEGFGNYALFHGNLSVAENEEIANYLIDEIASRTNFQIFIAGKNPSSKLQQKAKKYNVKIIANPPEEEMEKLVAEAHIQLMLTFQPTGFKHKLLLSVYRGRHIIANSQILSGSGMETLVNKADSTLDIVSEIEHLRHLPFSNELIVFRHENLPSEHINNIKLQDLINNLF